MSLSFVDLEAGRGSSDYDYNLNRKRDPTQAVTKGVFEVNTAVSTFQRLVNTLGTRQDTPQHREKLRKTRLRIANLAKDTSAKLKQLKQASVVDTDQATNVDTDQATKIAKIEKDFDSVMKEFQKAHRVATEREVQYASFDPQSGCYTRELDRYSESDARNSEHRIDLKESTIQMQEVSLLENEIVFNEAIIEEREQGIQEIQKDIGELHEIFTDLGVLVRGQGEIIVDIEKNIENSAKNVEQGTTELKKAAKTQISNSSLICLLLTLLGLFLLIVIFILTS